MKRFPSICALALSAMGCSPSELLSPPPEDQGFQLAMDFDAPAAAESWKCQIETAPFHDVQQIHRVQHKQTAAVHSMDIFVLVSSGAQRMPDGLYDCGPLYDQYPKLIEETILYASLEPELDLTLPDGVAAVVPPGLKFMYEVEYVNPSASPVHFSSRVNAWELPPDQPLTGTLGGFVLRNRHLTLPPHAEKTEWAQCTMDSDVDVLFLSSHTRRLGKDVQILKYGGADAGTLLYENTDWQAPPLQSETPPLHLAKGEGIELRCQYQNDGDQEVHWGFSASDELCNGVLVFTPGNGARCNMVASSSGALDN
jgi:hypothetical protein